jgi:teichuronic acid biosynthesis glycosyltransferase TuaH
LNVVFLSHTAMTDVFRVGSHHLARELSRQGHAVVHASTPLTIAHLAKLAQPNVRRRARLAFRPRRDADRVEHLVALAPMPLGIEAATLNTFASASCARALRASLRRAGMSQIDVALVDQPLFDGVLDRLPVGTVVYRPTDAHTDGPLARAERRLTTRADGIVATSAMVLDNLGPVARRLPSIVLENGVEFARFARAASTGPGIGAVYVGALDARFDWEAVLYMARAVPDAPIRLAGPVAGAPPELPGNVQLLGPIPYDDVPELLGSAAVGLLPLTRRPRNDSRSPMKYYEYLAAGLWVVASETPTLAARPAPGVALYRSAPEAARQLACRLRHRARNDAGVAAARPFDWSARAAALATFIASLP